MTMDYSIQQQLFNICGNGDAQETKRLLSKRRKPADAKKVDINGNTALIWAAMSGNVDCVNVLLPLCDPKAANQNGHTAIDIAMLYGHMGIAKLIKKYLLAQAEREELGRIIATSTQVKQRSKSL